MKEITILSGKGGTGKTTITAALASVAENAVFCDNDVDAADLHLIFNPVIQETHSFTSGWEVNIDTNTCTDCNLCIQHCRFVAIHKNDNGDLHINPFQCEGCRLCERICPSKAISSTINSKNNWYMSTSRFGSLIHADMGPGEENSGKLVTQVRKIAKEVAVTNKKDFVINDGPPGIGCAAIASVTGTDRILLVIEPTKSSFHDVVRLIELIDSFRGEAFALINKYDINKEVVTDIEKYLIEKKIPLLAKIPFTEEMVKSMIKGKTIIEYNPESEITNTIKEVWEKLKA